MARGEAMRHLTRWAAALVILWAGWRLFPLGWEFVKPYTAVILTYGQHTCDSARPWIDICLYAHDAGSTALLDYHSFLDLLSQFIDLSDGRIDQGFAAVAGGLAVLGGAYIGFAAPAAEQRRAEKMEAKAIAETLADEIGSIAGHIDSQLRDWLDKNASRNDADAKRLAERLLPPPTAFEAFVGRIHWIGRLRSAPDLVRSIFVWYSYAENIRNLQKQLRESIRRNDDKQTLLSTQQSIAHRIRNLRFKAMWKDLERNFDALNISLQSRSDRDFGGPTPTYMEQWGDNIVPLKRAS